MWIKGGVKDDAKCFGSNNWQVVVGGEGLGEGHQEFSFGRAESLAFM